MASVRFDCPKCEVVASLRHNFIRHLTATHGIEAAEAEQLAIDRERPGPAEPTSGSAASYVTPGHLRSVALLEDRSAAWEKISRFRAALGGVAVLLRPIDAGLTVMSLDVERCRSMISVGAKAKGGLLRTLPPSSEQIALMVSAYERKRDELARASPEELFSLSLITSSVAGDLWLGSTRWIFVAHEWRLPLSTGSTGKIDLLGFDPVMRRLVVIELKASKAHTAKIDANGWDAARQADEYADAIWQGRDELYPFFDRLIAAQAQIYLDRTELPTIDPATRPATAVWWPDRSGDHTPAWPAWNSSELAVASDSPRVARYRKHQSWWREEHRAVGPGPHPTVQGRLVGSMLATEAVAVDRRLNFIDEAAYQHAEQRAREVQAEGGTLDAKRLFSNLLSSMPMCFNLFGAIGSTPGFLNPVRAVFDADAGEIDAVVCEAPSPPQWDDRTAFDAQVDYRTRSGEPRFFAVETKYTEPFGPTRYDRARYRQVADESGWFEAGAAPELLGSGTNQLWRGLLLMSVAESHLSATGRYVVVAPEDDSVARAAVDKVRSWMVPHAAARLGFVSVEDIVERAADIPDCRLNVWSSRFRERYLPPSRGRYPPT